MEPKNKLPFWYDNKNGKIAQNIHDCKFQKKYYLYSVLNEKYKNIFLQNIF